MSAEREVLEADVIGDEEECVPPRSPAGRPPEHVVVSPSFKERVSGILKAGKRRAKR